MIEVRDGPIPDAAELARYALAHPDAPAIILEEFRSQGKHRRVIERRRQILEKKVLEAAVASERMGTACALFIALCGFVCASVLVAGGHGLEGTIIFGVDVAALVCAFIHGRPRGVHV